MTELVSNKNRARNIIPHLHFEYRCKIPMTMKRPAFLFYLQAKEYFLDFRSLVTQRVHLLQVHLLHSDVSD